MTLVIGVDPGVTTGVAIFDFPEGEEPEYLAHYQFGDPDNVWREIEELALEYRDGGNEVILVVEQFDKRPGVINPDFTPKYVSRDIQNNITGFEIVWQIPAAAMNLVKTAGRTKGPDQLKRFGWYLVNNVHANDAARHCIVYAVEKLKHKATILRGWPRREDN